MDLKLRGKRALVTGSTAGIGFAIARGLARERAEVIVNGRSEQRVAEAIQRISSEVGSTATGVAADLSSAEGVNRLIEGAGRVDILVNNAGIFVGKGVEDASMDDWHRLVAVNLTGVVLGTRAALPHLKANAKQSPHGSAIVNLASIAGLVGSQLDPLYSLTKGGVTLFTKSTALEFGRKGYKIRVNSIHPGLIETDMGQQTFVMRAKQVGTNDTEKAREATLALHPIGRLGMASDIAKGIVFLASDDAGFMTGAGLVVDGGWTAH
jgi:NAD(P)-dependent dehydrogenase (short-subunit alcohol dehydrogenase family)